MPKTIKKTLVAKIVDQTGVNKSKAKGALEAVLAAMKQALADGKTVDLGKLGQLSVAERPIQARISGNLDHVGPTILRLHQKHPKTVHLISKRGNKYLRELFVQGARSVLQHREKQVPELSRWLAGLLGRTHQNVVIVALANKLAGSLGPCCAKTKATVLRLLP